MKNFRFVKGLAVLAVALVWAALPVMAADTAKADEKKPVCPMSKHLGLDAGQQAKVMELCKSHRQAVRALLNDEQKKKFDAMGGCMHGAMAAGHACAAAHKCAMAGKCLCMKDGKCACVAKDGKCACSDKCPCKKDGKCVCPCCAAKCAAQAKGMAEAKAKAGEKDLPCAKTCATPCTKKEKEE